MDELPGRAKIRVSRNSANQALQRFEFSCQNRRGCEQQFYNGTGPSLPQTIPDYFSGVVLLRSSPNYPETFSGELRFQTLFNVLVIWMALFIGLSKGLKSYGKVSFLFGILPVVGFIVFCTKVVGLLPAEAFTTWFYRYSTWFLTSNSLKFKFPTFPFPLSSSDWSSFTYSGSIRSWVSAGRECFFTWVFLGAVISQLSSHNRFRHRVIRDTTAVVVVTLVVLVLAGFLGVAIRQSISPRYEYTVSSFGTEP